MIKILELFGGIGSPRKALENLGYEVKTTDYVDINKYSAEAYNILFNENFNIKDIKEWNNKEASADILAHGSPCTDFSISGKMDITLGRSILFMEVLRIIEKVLKYKSYVVLWENVKGLLCKKNIKYFNYYLSAMEKLGYKNHYKVLNSKDFGIPQSRNRVFVVSILKGQTLFNNDFNFDNLEKTEMKPLKSYLEKEVDKSYFITQNSMKKAIEAGKIKIVDNVCETITTKQFRWNNAGVVKVPILEMETKDFSNFITIPRQSDGEVINGSHNRVWKYDKYIGTIAASTNTKIALKAIEPIEGVPIFIIDGKPYHLRVLTPRETWRLMGWKDCDIDKVIHLPKSHLYQMAGNAIVIPVLEAIFKELLEITKNE